MSKFLKAVATLALLVASSAGALAGGSGSDVRVIDDWYRLTLELVRQTPTYSPPVASRTFAYLGIIAYEARSSSHAQAVTLAGQLNGLMPLPDRDRRATYDEAVILNAALSEAVRAFFPNAGANAERATQAMARRLRQIAEEGVDPATVARSAAFGRAVANHVIEWSQSDGAAQIQEMGVSSDHEPIMEPARWVPTSMVAQQQKPLLPHWGSVRPFAMPTGATCRLPPPPAYSEAPGSPFFQEAREVYETTRSLTDEQRAIARFWSDDPMQSFTPPGHWVSIALEILDAEKADALVRADVLARLGVAVADAFIGCWDAKFEHDLLRPVTYIRRVMDPTWTPLLNTPPFPEYPSGHSTQSAAAAVVLGSVFGDDVAFTDSSHEADGIEPRTFASFEAAAAEAAVSRLYGGIHFRAAIERGLDQGRCIGAHAAELRTLK